MNPDPNVDMTPSITPTAGQVIQPLPQPMQTGSAAVQPLVDALPPLAAPGPVAPGPVAPAAPATATPAYTAPSPAAPAASAPASPAPAYASVLTAAPTPQLVDTSTLFAPDNPGAASSRKKHGHMGLVLAVVGIVSVVTLAAGAYVVFGSKLPGRSDTKASQTSKPAKSSSAASKSGSSTQAAAPAKALSTLSSATLVSSAPVGYAAVATATSATFQDYGKTLSSGYTCEFGYGMLTTAQLPGSSADEIADNSLKSYRTNQASDTTIASKKGTSLTLADTAATSTTYTMPTYDTVITYGDGAQIVSHYSITILGDTNRLIINRTCTTDGKTKIDAADVAKLDTAAAKITVTRP